MTIANKMNEKAIRFGRKTQNLKKYKTFSTKREVQ